MSKIYQHNNNFHNSNMASSRFNVEEWLKSIDIWDPKYDYVQHDSHWLISEWSDKCEKCLKSGKKPEPKPATTTATATATITSSPLKSSTSLNSTASHTMRNDITTQSSPKVATPPEPIIPMTPIAPPTMNTRTFVTPFNGNILNETFSRSTRKSTRKLMNQTAANQDLINLNETFDLYKSALEETPRVEDHPPAQQQPLNPKVGTRIPVRSSRYFDYL